MGRAIISVIAGFIAMGLVLVGGLSAMLMTLGPERAFKPGTYDVTTTWVIVTPIIGFIAAIIGGWVAAAIAKTSTPPKVLALLILALGLVFAVYSIFIKPAGTPAPRPATVTVLNAIRNAKEPPVLITLHPIVGATGVLIGLRVREKSKKANVG